MARFALKKSAILRSKAEIEHLFAKGTVYKSTSFDIIYQEETTTQVLFAASKKIKQHVRKNRARRLVKEVFRLHQHELSQPLHLAIIAKPALLTAAFEEVCDEFRAFIQLKAS